MSYQERNTLVAIFVNVSVMAGFAWLIWTRYGEGAFAEADGLAIWAQTVLWIIPASIVATIVVTIVFSIVFAIATREADADTVVDERDRSIGIKGMRVTMVVASAGFIGAMVALAVGWPAFAAFNIILAGFALGDLLGSATRLVLYRGGI